jgi:hypothetical protein
MSQQKSPVIYSRTPFFRCSTRHSSGDAFAAMHFGTVQQALYEATSLEMSEDGGAAQ